MVLKSKVRQIIEDFATKVLAHATFQCIRFDFTLTKKQSRQQSQRSVNC